MFLKNLLNEYVHGKTSDTFMPNDEYIKIIKYYYIILLF